MLFKDLTISSRLFSMVLATILAMLVIGGFALHGLYENLMAERQQGVRYVVDATVSMLKGYQTRVAKGELTREQAQRQAIDAIAGLRYGQTEYFWIIDHQPRILVHPFQPSLVGTDVGKFQDPDGYRLFSEMVRTVETQGDGFVHYRWPRPGDLEPVPKLSYVKDFAPWGWIIGSGVYIGDVEQIFRQQAGTAISIGVSVLAVVVLVSSLLSRSITRPLTAITADMGRLAKGDLSLPEAPTECKGEIGELLRAMNAFKHSQIEVEHLRRERDEIKRREEENLRKLSQAVEQSPGTVIIADLAGNIEYVNRKFTETTGYDPEAMLGKNLRQLMSDRTTDEQYRDLWRALSAGQEWRGELLGRKKSGELFWEDACFSPIKSAAGEVTHYLASKEDISVRKEYEQRLLHQANYDHLTDLPNRLLALDRLEQALAHASRKDCLVGVLYVDLDQFKIVNDTVGHATGDRLLIAAAQRLRGCVRAEDTVARLGGDEFLVVLPDLAMAEHTETVAHHILEAFTKPFLINQHEFFVSASIGITVYPNDSLDPQVLLRNADVAMYLAKEAGRNTYRFFSPEISAKTRRRAAVETQLRHALERDELSLYFQPLIDIGTEQVVGAEALIRWHNQALGWVTPDEFIPLAEEMGLIVPIGEWVLETACRRMSAWHRSINPSLFVAVNVASQQFRDRRFLQNLQQILRQTGFPPQHLELEITERVLMDDVPATTQVLQTIKDMGLRLSIDDFGTGYSSLSYLKRFPVDTLKIDRAFVTDVTSDPEDASLTRAIIAMGRSLGLQLIGEGVEQGDQLAFLRDEGCGLAQGYYFSRPLPAEQFEAYLASVKEHPCDHRLID